MRWLILIIFLGCFFGAAHFLEAQTQNDLPSSVATGDLVFVEGFTLNAAVVHLFGGQFAAPVHVGILLIDENEAKIIHADPRIPRGHDQPGVIIEHWSSFARRGRIYGGKILRARPANGDDIAAAAAHFANSGVPFDYDLDWNDRSAFYCTELVDAVFIAQNINLLAHMRAQPKIVLPAHLMSSDHLVFIGSLK